MPIVNHASRIVERLAQLANRLDEVAHLTAEIIDDVTANLGSAPQTFHPFGTVKQDSDYYPIADRTTFAVHWHGKSCYLGNTLPFRFFERLARRPNQLIPCDQLLDDVWQCCRSREAMRSVVKVLRQKLSRAGMVDLAKAIDGTTARHYGLILNGRL
ncbi:MAG: helix-turn-helix domain-containing protein [Pirellulales bacterium]|nr:helix-turn-helix domain-containing protein [Pirellulales bacterium]